MPTVLASIAGPRRGVNGLCAWQETLGAFGHSPGARPSGRLLQQSNGLGEKARRQAFGWWCEI